MFADTSLSERFTAATPPPRAKGALRLVAARAAGTTFARDVEEFGPLRVRFPRAIGTDALEAVLLNTGGGVVGGDNLVISLVAEEASALAVTSQAAEKLYRSDGTLARIDLRLSVASGARLAWLPQETIVFNGAELERTIEADVAHNGALTLCETLVFGRAARGEALTCGRLVDRWRIRRDGILIFAEGMHLEGPIDAILARPAIAAGARAVATLVHVAPAAESRLVSLRAALAMTNGEAGASAFDGMLTARLIARDSGSLRTRLAAAFLALGVHPPRAFTL